MPYWVTFKETDPLGAGVSFKVYQATSSPTWRELMRELRDLRWRLRDAVIPNLRTEVLNRGAS